MTLVTCRECGKEISTSAKTCPHCGVPSRRRSGVLPGVLAVVLALGVVALCSVPTQQTEVEKLLAEAGQKSVEHTPKQVAIWKTKIEKYSWSKGGFETVLLLDITLQNRGDRDVKDVEVSCDHIAKSGTKIGKSVGIIHEVFEAQKSRRIKQFSMGFLDQQVGSIRCEVTGLMLR